MKINYHINEIEKVAESFLQEILKTRLENLASKKLFVNFPARATVVCLTGDLGAGKTTLMQSVGKILGIENKMPSPTFVLRRDYVLSGCKYEYKNLIHIDAYRLDKPEMINQVLTKEEIENPENLIVIEWGELLDKNLFTLTFEIKHVNENEREIILK
jgi:tRNA threonylcarbamoyladenosine biosynthesis protein TsaE